MNRLLSAVAALAAIAVGMPTAMAQPPEQEFLDVDAKPVLNWSVPDRYTASWNAYNQAAGYDHRFVSPSIWMMSLDACASTSVRRITSFTFTISQVGTIWTQTRTTTACHLNLHTLPAQGRYSLKLVLHTDMGPTPGVSVPASRNAEIRDILIVSMGDSLASGEGNPDVPASPGRPARWRDGRCHRSANSGPALAAKAYEAASPYTSVTFLSMACSGAEIRHLVNVPYGGIEPNGQLLRPQVDEVQATIGIRTIDSLLISAGLNNLGFSDIIERCVWNNNFLPRHESCVTEDGLADKIYELRREYAYLALTILFKLPNTGQVYLNDYPSNLFLSGACGKLSGSPVPGLGIDSAEGREIDKQGGALRAQIVQATESFDEYHWNFIGSLNPAFRPHGYCASSTWFVSYEKSIETQGNKLGTAHPNAAGHAVYGDLIRRALVAQLE